MKKRASGSGALASDPNGKGKARRTNRPVTPVAAPGSHSHRERSIALPTSERREIPARNHVSSPEGAGTLMRPARPLHPLQLATAGRPLFTPLFAPMDAFCKQALELLPEALDKVMPLNRAHREDLPEAVKELSGLLTSERGALGRSYWSAPRFVSAYLRYFLPWNLVRLTRLLPGLSLPDPASLTEGREKLMVDLGSGPLTLPLALWLSRPDWRAVPLTVVCVDTVPRPMELGWSLFDTLAGLMNEPLQWRIRLMRLPLIRAMREVRGSALLVTAGNVLNESHEKGDVPLDERMGHLGAAVRRLLHPQGAALFVEPGTRLGGTLTATLRENALDEGLLPVAPCTHTEPCPLLGRRDRGWCHASQDAGSPVWLAALSKESKLPKDSLSLAFMLLRPDPDDPRDVLSASDESTPDTPAPHMAATPGAQANPAESVSSLPLPGIVGRVLSDAFPVPGLGYARYACTAEGLAILPAAGNIPSGALVSCRRPAVPRRDGKSGAIELHWQKVR